MKKLISVIMIVILSACICTSAAFAVNNDTIYDNTSTGSMVVRIQMRLRELGYLSFKPTGSYRSMTVAAAKAFQVNYRDNGGYDMMVDGKIGPQSLDLLFRPDAKRVSLSGISIPSGPKSTGSGIKGDPVDWSSVKSMLEQGKAYTIIDYYTGKTFELVFCGGVNHAEMELPQGAEIDAFMAICGPEFNYLKRPVVISLEGKNIAASIQCWPHGSDTIGDNNMEGHVCLFFEGSSSHVGNMPDVEHNENIKTASGQ